MKPLRHFWPLIAVVTFQLLVCQFPAAPGWEFDRFYLYGAVDLFIGGCSAFSYWQQRRIERRIEELEAQKRELLSLYNTRGRI